MSIEKSAERSVRKRSSASKTASVQAVKAVPGSALENFLSSSGAGRKLLTYKRNSGIFSQGDPADAIFYIQEGTVKLSVVSDRGKEAVIAFLEHGDFFGEGCLASQLFMNKFRKLGFIKYNGTLEVHSSLLNVRQPHKSDAGC